MKTALAISVAIFLAAGTAQAVPTASGSGAIAAAENPALEFVKRGGKGFGKVKWGKPKAFRGRGLRRGWYIGRGNPHRYRGYRRWR